MKVRHQSTGWFESSEWMHDTLRCPDCSAELTLPSLPAGQDVQCPRCQSIFAPRQPPVLPPPPQRKPPILRDEPDDDIPSDPRRLVRPDPLTGQWKAIFAGITLTLSVFSYGLQAYLSYERGRDLKEEQELIVVVKRAWHQRPPVDGLIPSPWKREAALYHELAFWSAVVFFLVWLFQASRNLKLLQCAGLSHGPGMSVVSYFIPLMNLYRPYFIMQEIWRGSDPRAVGNSLTWIDAPTSAAVRYWWFFLLAALGLRLIGRQFQLTVEPATIASMTCIANLGMFAAGVLLIGIVYVIAARQRARYERLYAD